MYLDGHNFERELLQHGYARLLVIEPNHALARDMLDDELMPEHVASDCDPALRS